MKLLIIVISTIFLACCATQSKINKYNFEKDSTLSESAKQSLRERQARDKLSFEKIEEKYHSTQLESFYFLDEVVKHAIKESKWDKVEFYAEKLLQQAQEYKDNWNYGNAIFTGNIALGQAALQKNRVSDAKKYLLKASKTPGSPQLGTFGPLLYDETKNFLLDLLSRGEKKVVIEFINNCRAFNTMPERTDFDRAIQQIENNQTPDFLYSPMTHKK